MANQNKSASKVLPLTSVRFFAAFYVVLFHTLPDVGAGIHPGRFLQLGFLSVSFFFTLSGFILALVYLEGDSSLNLRRFWVARFARIFPLYAATLLLALPPVLGGMIRREGSVKGLLHISRLLLANVFMIQVWDVKLRGLDNPNWSVAVEVFFYLLFPFFALLLRNRSSRALYIAGSAFYVCGMLLVTFASGLHIQLDECKFNPILHMHEFLVGTCAGLLLLRAKQAKLGSLEKFADVLLLGALTGFAVFFFFYPQIPFLLVHDGLLTPLYILVILALFAGKGIVQRLLSHSWLVLLGEASFGLYLLHIPIWIFAKYIPSGHSAGAYPIFLLVIILLSVASFYVLEVPSRRYILQRLGVRARETQVEAAILQ